MVYVATGENYPDALAGSVAAAMADAPVLLVSRDTIPADTAAELVRLAPDEIVVLGGLSAVSAAVQAQLGSYAGSVRRLAGVSRFSTAAAISKDTFSSSLAAIVATGENFPDALVGGAGAGKWQVPILLVTKYTVPAETAAELSRLTGVPCAPFAWAPPPTTTTTTTTAPSNCDPSYPDFCIPPPPPPLNCVDHGRTDFTGRQPDPHRVDRDKDGIGCES